MGNYRTRRHLLEDPEKSGVVDRKSTFGCLKFRTGGSESSLVACWLLGPRRRRRALASPDLPVLRLAHNHV